MKLTLILAAFLNIFSFGQTQNNFTIHGTIEDSDRKKIILWYTKNDGTTIYDTAIVREGKFSFSGYVDEPVQALLKFENPYSSDWFYLDSSDITIYAKINPIEIDHNIINTLSMSSIKGSRSDSLQKDFFNFIRKTVLSKEEDSLTSKLIFEKAFDIVQKYPNHNIVVEFLRDEGDILTYPQAKIIYKNLSVSKQASYGIKWSMERYQKTSIGTPYNFIELPDTSGEFISGKEIPHKYMLIEFWASGCSPCRAENPNLISLYKKYNKMGFEILGISLDDRREGWIRAINKDKLPWKQISELNEFQGKIPTYYALSFIPFNLLIDENGIIIAKDLRGEKLVKKIDMLFSKK